MSIHWRAVAAVTGGILVHITIGNAYTFGNLTPYLTSYLRQRTSQHDLQYGDSVWISSLFMICDSSSVFLGGLISRKLRARITVLLGSWLMSAGIGLTYFTIQHSFIGVILTYGVITGLGDGIAYAVPLSCAMKWMPGREGLAGGLVLAGIGVGMSIFTQIQTTFVNPENLHPDLEVQGEMYFSQNEVLDRVPWVFVLCGGIYAVMQLIGVLLISEPSQEEVDEITAVVIKQKDLMNEDILIMDAVMIEVNGKDNVTNSYQQKTEETEKNTFKEEINNNFTPLQVLRTRAFHILWSCLMLNTLGLFIVCNLYKAYGQRFIKDDFFLTTTGSVASVFNCLGRMFWGSIVDRYSYKITILCMCASFSCLVFTLDVTSIGGKPLFFIYICLLFGIFSGNYILFSVATAKAFGLEYYAVNYGFLFTAQAISSLLSGVFSSELLRIISWFGMFTLVGCLSFASMLFIMMY